MFEQAGCACPLSLAFTSCLDVMIVHSRSFEDGRHINALREVQLMRWLQSMLDDQVNMCSMARLRERRASITIPARSCSTSKD